MPPIPPPPTLRRSSVPKANLLASFPPAPGTAYWTCRTGDCRDELGRPSRWPYRVRKPDGRTSRVGCCARCYRGRPLTDEERARVAGDPATGEPGVLNLAHRIANDYARRFPNMDRDAFTSAALEAVCTASATFDPCNGYAFTTHAIQHVRGRINDRFRINEQIVRRGTCVRVADVATDDDSDPLAEAPARDTDADVHAVDLNDLLARARLSRRERDVLTRIYGLDGRGRTTLADVGRRYGLSRERIRQIRLVALTRLRAAAGVAGVAAEAA